MKIKSKFKSKGKSSPASTGPRGPRRFPPGPSASIAQRGAPRTILPPRNRPMNKYSPAKTLSKNSKANPIKKYPAKKPKQTPEDIFKKLKEMGK